MKTIFSAPSCSPRDRILGGLWGSLVGDALGVPVEFKSRETVQRDPVRDLRAGGSHGQPAGTWSDDSSLLLCTVDSLLSHTFDTEDLGQKFVQWRLGKLWTPHGSVFDIGIATSRALLRISEGVRAEDASAATARTAMEMVPSCGCFPSPCVSLAARFRTRCTPFIGPPQ